jgi:hypothetical protein
MSFKDRMTKRHIEYAEKKYDPEIVALFKEKLKKCPGKDTKVLGFIQNALKQARDEIREKIHGSVPENLKRLG